jgi:hypothetical protein
VARIQELNQNYMGQKDMAEIVKACFRKPKEGEDFQSMDSLQLLEMIKKDYPSLQINRSVRICLGLTMKELGFSHTAPKNVPHYQVIPVRAA